MDARLLCIPHVSHALPCLAAAATHRVPAPRSAPEPPRRAARAPQPQAADVRSPPGRTPVLLIVSTVQRVLGALLTRASSSCCSSSRQLSLICASSSSSRSRKRTYSSPLALNQRSAAFEGAFDSSQDLLVVLDALGHLQAAVRRAMPASRASTHLLLVLGRGLVQPSSAEASTSSCSAMLTTRAFVMVS